jgi:hypothetical protein
MCAYKFQNILLADYVYPMGYIRRGYWERSYAAFGIILRLQAAFCTRFQGQYLLIRLLERFLESLSNFKKASKTLQQITA